MNNDLDSVQEWYQRQCNGAWERLYGITITSISNPGWDVEIDISYTNLEDAPFDTIQIANDQSDEWMFCKLEKREKPNRLIFHGGGAPSKLDDILRRFIEWANKFDSVAKQTP